MKLGKLPEKDPVESKPVGLKKSAWAKIQQYQRLYAKEHGKEIKTNELVGLMLETFMEGDKDFQKFLKDEETANAA
jgi:hypothetical protein